jgi:hypothetical protein
MKKREKRSSPLIALNPHAAIPDSDAWLYRNLEALASVRRGLEDVAAGRTRLLGSFARFAR